MGGLRMGVKVGRFEDLEVWKEGMRLATKIYRALNTCRDYGLRDQMQRSAVSMIQWGTLLPSDLMKLPKGSWREGTEGRDRRSEKDRGQKSRGRGSEGKGQGSVVRGQEKKQRYAARVVGGTPRDQWSDVRGQQGKQRFQAKMVGRKSQRGFV